MLARRDALVSDDPSPRGGARAVPWAVLGLGGRERTICTVHQTLKAGERRAGFYAPVRMWVSHCSRALYTLQSISIHHSERQSSQPISVYDREIGAKISVSVSISRFLRVDNVLY